VRQRTAVLTIQATKALDPGAFAFSGNPGDLKSPIMERIFRAMCPAFRIASLHNGVG